MPVTDPAARARFLAAVRFNEHGLLPVIAQAAPREGGQGGEVLMMAWMNAEALEETLATGRVVYFSRSRQALWRKGESSGQVQHWTDLRLDCDGDTLLALVEQKGVACHTGRRSCFFQALRDGEMTAITAPDVDPKVLYAG